VRKFAALFVAGAAATASSGCTTHNCDPNSYDYFDGRMVDATHFVTNDLDQTWLTFNGNTTIRVWFPPEAAGLYPFDVTGYVGTDPTPNGGDEFHDGDNFTKSVGQLFLYNFVNTDAGVVDGRAVGGGFWATNSTCAGYFTRFVVEFLPMTPTEGGAPDAGLDESGAPGGEIEDAPNDAMVTDAAAD